MNIPPTTMSSIHPSIFPTALPISVLNEQPAPKQLLTNNWPFLNQKKKSFSSHNEINDL
jgi:hypothetical protein